MRDPFDIVALTPCAPGDPAIAAAAAHAGAMGVLDLEYVTGAAAIARACLQIEWLCTRVPAHHTIGVRLAPAQVAAFERILAALDDRASAVVIFTECANAHASRRARGRAGDHRVLVEVRSVEAYLALRHARLSIDGIIACGHETGGFVGDDTTFVLVQKLLQHEEPWRGGLPLYARGGVGLHAAAGCRAVGVRGVVLDDHLLLTPESPLPDLWQRQLTGLSGAEAVVLGHGNGLACRVLDRPTFAPLARLKQAASTLESEGDEAAMAAWQDTVAATVGWDAPDAAVWPIGQAIGQAESLRRRYGTTERIVRAMFRESGRLVSLARELRPLASGATLARSHATEFPIVQGPMTRVTDRPEFAAAVADAGALPLIALAVLNGEQARPILLETAERLGPRPWGVGVLGFVPPDLKRQQLTEILRVRPPFALLAGGRPDDAAELEAAGISTYVHTPTAALLRHYLAQGVRRFVFEGRECGGHVGPLCSFPLWEAMIVVLLDRVAEDEAARVHVLFAGGIHDARSAAIVSAMAAPLARQGIRCGVLMGTAYLFTEEAVRLGAIRERYQREAIACRDTVLLTSGIGHANRVARTAFAIEFEARRRALLRAQRPAAEVRDALERLTIGRLRLASKGLVRSEQGELVPVSDAEQEAGGTYMLGQVATLRSSVCTMRALHEDVTEGATRQLRRAEATAAAGRTAPEDAVAIIGFAALLPGAPAPARFWRNVLDQVNAITEIPPSRWDSRLIFDSPRNPDDRITSKWGGFVPDIRFEPITYRMPPAVMRHVCAHQLLALDLARQALADAGYATRAFDRDRTAVIIGLAETGGWVGNKLIMRSMLPFLLDDEDERLLARLPAWTGDSFTGMIGNVTTGRVANALDLGGPNFCVDAACASALLALDVAVRELQSGRSTMALAGGVDTSQTPFSYAAFTKTQALSPTGRARVFDKAADGIVISEGVCIAVLKRLDGARRDGDRVYAVIRGSGGSSDGRGLSLTAPRTEGQRRAIERALADADIEADTLGLYEAHGTGTPLGDRTELETLTRILQAAGTPPRRCAVGAVKSLVGHTKAAAGVVGVMKAALALHHRVLPPHAGVEDPLEALTDPAAPVYMLNRPRPWFASAAHPRRAGVSAFGFGGTNGSLILEEADERADDVGTLGAEEWPCELLLFTAASREALADRLRTTRVALEAGAQPELRALALALARDGDAAPPGPRLAIVADHLQELRETLAIAERLVRAEREESVKRPHNLVYVPPTPAGPETGAPPPGERLAFLFPGQGSQYPAMALDQTLYFRELRDAIEEANATLQTSGDGALSDCVFPPAAFSEAQAARQRQELAATHRAQPAIGAISMGLLQLLDRVGVRPDVVAGHSYGELTALHAAGALARSTLLRLSEARGQAMARCCTGGGMMSVQGSRDVTASIIQGIDDVVIANHNAPEQTVISGSADGLAAAATRLASAGLRAVPLPVAGPFHSPLMAPAADAWRTAIAEAAIGVPRLPVYGNADGTPYPQRDAHPPDPRAADAVRARLGGHLLHAVEFVSQIERMYVDGVRTFVEVGPGSVLCRLTSLILGDRPHVCVATDPQHGRLRGMLTSLGQLAVRGVGVKVSRLFDDRVIPALSLDALEETRPAPPTRNTWWVDGSAARPHDPTAFGDEPAALVTLDRRTPVDRVDRREVPTPPVAASPPPAAPAPQPARADIRDDSPLFAAYLAYQETMREFLGVHERALASFFAMAQGGHAFALQPPRMDLPSMQDSPVSAAVMPVADAAAATATAAAADASPPPPAFASVPPPAATAIEPIESRSLDLEQILRQSLSAQTGYPIEMLQLDLDLASDLGVDSIRHVQLLHEVAEVLSPARPQLVADAMDDLLQARTLRAMLDRLTRVVDGAASVPLLTSDDRPRAADRNGHEAAPSSTPDVRCPRFLLRELAQPLIASYTALRAGAVIVTEDAIGVAPLVRALLEGRRIEVITIGRDVAADPDTLRARVRDVAGPIAAILHLAPLSRAAVPDRFEAWRRLGQIEAKALFQLLNLTARRTPGGLDGVRVIAASLLGGRFGRDRTRGAGGGPGSPIGGAASGLLKCLQLEWPTSAAKGLDFAASYTPAQIADSIVHELLHPTAHTEVGYPDEGRAIFLSAEAPLDHVGTSAAQMPSGEWVVLATGGARGITAHAVQAIARPGMTVILVGRHAAPADEAPSSAGLSEADLRRHFIDQAAAGAPLGPPAAIEERIRGIVRDRDVRATCATLERAGLRVAYRACDVRDPQALPELLDWIYRTYGRLDAVLHGAGVIEDSLLAKKDWRSFDRVFDTKVDSTYLLAGYLRPRDLKLVVFFTSVAGRAGNAGQGDYAAANEVVNRFAWWLAAQWPHVRVMAINWGPWASAGMATDRVRPRLEARGINAIEAAAGRAFLAEEIAFGHAGDVEIIAGEGPWRADAAAHVPSAGARAEAATHGAAPHTAA